MAAHHEGGNTALVAKARVLIVDDDAGIRTLLRALLVAGGLSVAAEATNGAEAVALYEELHPDAVTMDLDMPVMNGVAAVRAICTSGCCPVVIVSGSQSSDLLSDALTAGARWHVAKRDADSQLVPVLHALLREPGATQPT
jgi:CheY-like chemotaxis protein